MNRSMRRYRVRPPWPAYADTPAIRAYARSVKYRRWRPYVLAGVLTYVLARKAARR